MNFGQRLKILRKQTGLSQGEFAKEVGFSQTYISNLENLPNAPRWATLLSIAEYCNVSPEYFYAGETNTPNPDLEYLERVKWWIQFMRYCSPVSEYRFLSIQAFQRWLNTKHVYSQALDYSDIEFMDID